MVVRDKQGRFVKGHSGNPRGRPRLDEEQRYLRTLRRALPEKEIQAIVERLVAEAKKGNVRAAQLLFAYAIGRPTEYINADLSSLGEPIRQTIREVVVERPAKDAEDE